RSTFLLRRKYLASPPELESLGGRFWHSNVSTAAAFHVKTSEADAVAANGTSRQLSKRRQTLMQISSKWRHSLFPKKEINRILTSGGAASMRPTRSKKSASPPVAPKKRGCSSQIPDSLTSPRLLSRAAPPMFLCPSH